LLFEFEFEFEFEFGCVWMFVRKGSKQADTLYCNSLRDSSADVCAHTSLVLASVDTDERTVSAFSSALMMIATADTDWVCVCVCDGVCVCDSVCCECGRDLGQ
jgi:hypothetical protein